jgi:hypothetical protein
LLTRWSRIVRRVGRSIVTGSIVTGSGFIVVVGWPIIWRLAFFPAFGLRAFVCSLAVASQSIHEDHDLIAIGSTVDVEFCVSTCRHSNRIGTVAAENFRDGGSTSVDVQAISSVVAGYEEGIDVTGSNTQVVIAVTTSSCNVLRSRDIGSDSIVSAATVHSDSLSLASVKADSIVSSTAGYKERIDRIGSYEQGVVATISRDSNRIGSTSVDDNSIVVATS